MALDEARLGAAIRARVAATGAALSPEAAAIYTAIAAAIVEEILNHANVSVPVDVGTSGLQTYNAGAGLVPTTGPITPINLDGSIT